MRIPSELFTRLGELSANAASFSGTSEANLARADSRGIETSEELRISPTLRLIQTLYAQVNAASDFDRSHVARVSQQIQAGQYEVGADDVAAAILQELNP